MIDEKKYKESIDKKMAAPQVTPVAPVQQPAPMPEMPQIQMPEMPQMQMPQYPPVMMPQFQAPMMQPQMPPVCCPFMMNMQCPMLQQMYPTTGGMSSPYMNYPGYMNPYGASQFTTYNPMGTMQY